MNIRTATISDLPLLVQHGTAILRHIADALPLHAPDTTTLAHGLLSHLQAPQCCAYIAEEDGKPIGAIGGRLERAEWDGGLPVARQVFLYVLPGHPSSQAGLRLLRTFESWGRDRGASVAVGASLDCLEPRADILFRRLGYRPSERYYVRMLQ